MNVLRSEWTKLRSVRSTWIAALSAVVTAVALGALGVSDVLTGSPSDLPAGWDPTAASLKGLLLAQLIVGMLGALSITPEFGTGLIGASLVVVPGRSRLLAAKAVVVAAVAFATGLVATLTSFTVVRLLLRGAGQPAAGPGDPGVVRALAGAVLYLTCIALLGLAVGALVRSSTTSLAVLVGALLLAPALMPALPGALGGRLAQYWPITAGQAAYAVVDRPGAVAAPLGLAILAAATALTGVAGRLVLRRRDV
ncbi:ABC transporter permease [Dactylosporangium sp. NPDC051541]|uniref:ABC transporter permease n=1 Tax=Dactylosporangium sp. NPDC051541 TaxID=3363977 RepID=UPI0037AA1AF5